MKTENSNNAGIKRLAITGAGPSALFMLKRLVDAGRKDIDITFFEKNGQPGAGMPYSSEGANDEHVTNVSDNEIPELVTTIEEWVKTVPPSTLKPYGIDPDNFNEYKVLPRLLFGSYLTAQFELLLAAAKKKGMTVTLYLNTTINDIIDKPLLNEVWVNSGDNSISKFDTVMISSGHRWPEKYEGKIPGYFDSPYPPSKLIFRADHPVAMKGASLTALDAIRTLARYHGKYERDETGKLSYILNEENPSFRIVMHSRSGLLPAVRFHLEDTHLQNDDLLSRREIKDHMVANGGFLSLDFLFEKDFKDLFRTKDPAFYERIKEMNMEEFVEAMMALRERLDPFVLLEAEYAEAEKSIRRKESVYWKEALAELSFALNYPAKHMSAEDMMRLKKTLMPLISVVIAFIPQSSCKELLALHKSGILDLIAVGEGSEPLPEEKGGVTYHYTDEEKNPKAVYYQTFIDCTGQPHLEMKDLPFESLAENETVSSAKLKFRSAEAGRSAKDAGDDYVQTADGINYYLKVPGIAINDRFQVLDRYDAINERIFMMAVPYIGGFNPDYSGLDFCAEASSIIAKAL